MKKSYLIIAAAVAMFTACQETDKFREINNQQEDNAISFTTFTSKQTRAAENSGADAYSDLEAYNTTFRVWGNKYIYKGTDAQSNKTYDVTPIFGYDESATPDYPGEKVEYKTTEVNSLIGNWDYDPIRFWDKTASYYDFYAASPFIPKNASGQNVIWSFDKDTKYISLPLFTVSGINRVTTATNGVAEFGVNTSIDNAAIMSYNQEDLMIATDIPSYTDYTSTTGVNLQFNHILSRLNIGIRKSSDLEDYYIKLKSFQINNMWKDGAFDEAGASSTSTPALAAGTIARWTGNTSKFATGEMVYNPGSNGLEITSTSAASDGTYQYIYEGLVIPQNVGYSKTVLATDDNKTADDLVIDGSNAVSTGELDTWSNPYIVIEYEIWTKKKYTDTELAELNAGKQEGDADYIPAGTAKEPAEPDKKVDGYKYFFNLAEIFGATATDGGIKFCEGWQNTVKITLAPAAIKFDAQVADWDEKFTDSSDNNSQTGTIFEIR